MTTMTATAAVQRGLSLNQPQDLRSLAVFRILLGLYLCYDVYSRLKQGRLSLLLYTSSSNSFLRPTDTPHKSPFHLIWFYRGSALFQIVCFTITLILALSFSLGVRCNGLTKLALWLSVTAMQSRNMHVHDGSDTYVRHLLLWACQLPVEKVWSVDAAYRCDKSRASVKPPCAAPVVAVWGLRLQIVLMYLGTVLNRTYDRGYLSQSEWLSPQLSAVHYSLNASFATRNNALVRIVQTTPLLSKMLTMAAMIMESMAPLTCLFAADKNDVLVTMGAGLLCSLHAGLLVCFNLPNWQFVGMLATVVWIPSSVMNTFQTFFARSFPSLISVPAVMEDGQYKKDDDLVTEEPAHSNKMRQRPFHTYFLLAYMVYNFGGERRWIDKHDGGDIGEAIRFSQYWVMFGTPPKSGVQAVFTATTKDDGVVYDGWEYIRSRRIVQFYDSDQAMTDVYPSPRWERLWDQWASRRDVQRARYFLEQLCKVEPEFQSLQITWKHLQVLPLGSLERFRDTGSDTDIRVECYAPDNLQNYV